MQEEMQQEIETLGVLLDQVVGFVVAYGFQIVGALVVLFVGLKLAGWAGRKTVELGAGRDFDPTVTRFAGNVVRIALIAIVVIITLSNFGITIAPLIALAGAAAFGGTLALQGPLSNYGAGLSIILLRPFTVGNTIEIRGTFGVVDDISLASTVLTGEDGERITVPNKEIVGQVIVNSHGYRVVETKIFIGADQDADKAVEAIRGVLDARRAGEGAPRAQVGIDSFSYGGLIVGARYWVPSLKYFQSRYAVNHELLKALEAAGVALPPAAVPAVVAPPLSADGGPG
jgi:small conductance mechanosensitive channel